MAIIERDVVLQGMDDDGNPTIDMPITRLGNIEASADIKAAPTAGDYIPMMDGEAKGQMKKVPATAFQTALTGIAGQVVGFDEHGNAVPQSVDVDWSSIKNKPNVALKSDLTSVYRFRGSVANFASLPTADNVAGDVWNVEATGMNYAWTGSDWDALGEVFEVESITNAEIDTILSGE